MLRRAARTGLFMAVAVCVVSQAHAFNGGMGAGCGGGIGSSSGCSGYASGSFGCTGYGGGYTGWTYGGGSSGLGNTSYLARGYKGWGLAGTRHDSSTVARSRSNSAPQGVRLQVAVPADAKLFINDLPTKSTGEIRQFSSTRFPPGTVFRYRVRAEFVSDGVPLVEERIVRLSDGQNASIEFGRAAPPAISEMAAAAGR